MNKIALVAIKEKFNARNLDSKVSEIMVQLYSILENMHVVFKSLKLEELYEQVWDIINSMSKIVSFYKEQDMKKKEQLESKAENYICKRCLEKNATFSKVKKVNTKNSGKHGQNHKLGGIFLYNQNY